MTKKKCKHRNKNDKEKGGCQERKQKTRPQGLVSPTKINKSDKTDKEKNQDMRETNTRTHLRGEKRQAAKDSRTEGVNRRGKQTTQCEETIGNTKTSRNRRDKQTTQ